MADINLEKDDVISSKEYKLISTQNSIRLIKLLLMKGSSFQINVKKSKINYTPELPTFIKESFGDVVLFDISGYSLETFNFDENGIFFNAGFGNENPIETSIYIKNEDIYQIIKDYKISLNNNFAALIEKEEKKEYLDDGINKSMTNFMLNPENAKFLKK
jgi:hypothetical protein